jgi:hypothetical protein
VRRVVVGRLHCVSSTSAALSLPARVTGTAVVVLAASVQHHNGLNVWQVRERQQWHPS